VLEDAPDKDFSQKPSFGRRDEGSSGFKKPYAPNPRKDEGFAPRKTYGSREDRPRDEKPRGEGGYKPSFTRDRDDRPASASGSNRDKFAKRFGASPKPAAAAKPFSTKFKGKPKK